MRPTLSPPSRLHPPGAHAAGSGRGTQMEPQQSLPSEPAVAREARVTKWKITRKKSTGSTTIRLVDVTFEKKTRYGCRSPTCDRPKARDRKVDGVPFFPASNGRAPRLMPCGSETASRVREPAVQWQRDPVISLGRRGHRYLTPNAANSFGAAFHGAGT
jgi:hypothetical protein